MSMTRRSFMGIILTAAVAPAFIRNAMAIKPLESGLLVVGIKNNLLSSIDLAAGPIYRAERTGMVLLWQGCVWISDGMNWVKEPSNVKGSIIYPGHTNLDSWALIGRPSLSRRIIIQEKHQADPIQKQ